MKIFFFFILGEQTFFGKFIGGSCLHGLMQWGRKSFTNTFSSNLSSVNLKNFPGHGGRHNSNQYLELWKDLFMRLMVKRFQRLSQVLFRSCWTWPRVLIYFLKSKHQKQGNEFEKHPLHTIPLGLRISCKAGLLSLNIFSGNMFFDIFIIGLF